MESFERAHRRHRARFGARRSMELHGDKLLNPYAKGDRAEIEAEDGIITSTDPRQWAPELFDEPSDLAQQNPEDSTPEQLDV